MAASLQNFIFVVSIEAADHHVQLLTASYLRYRPVINSTGVRSYDSCIRSAASELEETVRKERSIFPTVPTPQCLSRSVLQQRTHC